MSSNIVTALINEQLRLLLTDTLLHKLMFSNEVRARVPDVTEGARLYMAAVATADENTGLKEKEPNGSFHRYDEVREGTGSRLVHSCCRCVVCTSAMRSSRPTAAQRGSAVKKKEQAC